MITATENEILLEDENITIKKNEFWGEEYLHFQFQNKFTLDASENAVNVWSKECTDNPTLAHIHVWDCHLMTGFELPAKNLWMKNMVTFGRQIEKIIMISDNIVIRGAARLMSKFTTHHLEVYKSMEEWRVLGV